MNNEITYEQDGVTYTAEYFIDIDDMLTVLLPDGSSKTTWLNTLKPKHAAKTHLAAYVKSLSKKKNT